MAKLIKMVSRRLEGLKYLGETISIKNKGVEELSGSQRHKQPASPPPRSVEFVPYPAFILGQIVEKFRSATQGIDGYGHS